MPSCLIVGGGLAGLSCAAALAGAGFHVRLFEARPFPGGRATSYKLPGGGDRVEVVDNGQHILLRCCVNLLDFYRRLAVESRIEFHKELYFIEPGGRISTFRAGPLPAPAHFTGAFLGLRFLGLADKACIIRALLALRRERTRRDDLDRITMLDWLKEKDQSRRAIARFWAPVLVSAINEELGRMAARHAFQVMWLGFLATRDGYEMGVSSVPLAELYAAHLWDQWPNAEIRLGQPVERLVMDRGRVRGVMARGELHEAGYCVSAIPFERVATLAPQAGFDAAGWEHSPITGIHLWFDRPVTQLPHGALLDRTIHWFFNKRDGRHLHLVVSASRALVRMKKATVVQLALRELGEFLPEVRAARLEKSYVVKEVRATFSARPGLEARRPATQTLTPNLFLAGDWTRTGWPSTMEGAVRSGYSAAEAVCRAAGSSASFLLPDIA